MNGKMLRDAIISGANNISNNRQNVDALNVFPVPDGDTGTNMSMTISSAKRELERLSDDISIGEVAQIAASALLRGARGNSGVILSLLFRGFSKGLAGKTSATALDIANALALGVDAAYKAVMKPTEGTILTVSRIASVRAKEAAAELGDDIVGVWNQSIRSAAETLAKTPDMLAVLKKAGVVDAGGKGFLIVMEGMGAVINGGKIVSSDITEKEKIQPLTTVSFEELESEITFSYCTEFIVEKKDKFASILTLRAYLESIGDSVVVVDDEEIIKAHVHTDDPGKALQQGITLGRLSKIKIENMREQFERECRDRGEEPVYGNHDADKESKEEFAYKEVDPDVNYGFVAIAAGEGVANLFSDLGVANIVSGGQTMNPSTDDILKAIHATPAKNVFVLPNNKNIIMAAEQAVKLADRKVFVLHTKTIPQGLSAMLTFEESAAPNANCMAMTKAFEQVSTGQITFAARDSDFDGHKIKSGEILALDNGKLSFTDTDTIKATVRLTKNMIRKKGNDTVFITIIYGEDISQQQASQVEQQVKEKYPEVEVALIEGKQPIYYFIISID